MPNVANEILRSWSNPQLPALGATILVNLYTPMVVLLDAAAGSGSAGRETLSPEAATRRLYLCCRALMDSIDVNDMYPRAFAQHYLNAFGTLRGQTYGESAEQLNMAWAALPALLRLPASYTLLLMLHPNVSADSHAFKVEDWVPSDPFLGPVYCKYSCTVCGLLPAKATQQFQVCSLCKDPAAGQFCCKEPCFAAFWRAGHKNTCAGRDKLKQIRKGVKGGGGGEAGQRSGATGS
jgi:hypothetical protein